VASTLACRLSLWDTALRAREKKEASLPASCPEAGIQVEPEISG